MHPPKPVPLDDVDLADLDVFAATAVGRCSTRCAARPRCPGTPSRRRTTASGR